MNQPPVLDPWQEEAVDWLDSHPYGGLFDEVGLGKSYPAIVAALDVDQKLLVAPAHLLPQWGQYLREYNQSYTLVTGTPEVRLNLIAAPTDWILISYNMLSIARYAKVLTSLRWDRVIFDESHRLRGRNSKWTKASYDLKTPSIHFLSGDPIVKNGGDIFPVLRLIDRKEFSSYWRFVREWCHVYQMEWALEVKGIKDKEGFEQLLHRWFIRRLAKDLLNLEEPRVIPIPVELGPNMLSLHRKVKRDWSFEHPDLGRVDIKSGGALVHSLRRITAGSEKIDAVKGVLEDRRNERVVVYAWYRNSAMEMWEAIHRRPAYLITGATNQNKRDQLIESWKSKPDGVLVCTIESMKEGLNLQASHCVIFLEQDYLPMSNRQAIGRVQRRGQDQLVTVYEVYAEKTVDEAVRRVLHKRTEDTSIGAIDVIRELVELDAPLEVGYNRS